jgi:hypothetical protein
MHGESE